MIHITETGYYAGHPICDCDKQARLAAGDEFYHLPYSNIDAFMAQPNICPACKVEYDAAMAEDDELQTA